MKQQEFFYAVERLIKDNRKTYFEAPKLIIKDYNHELGITKDYNGRQILELLQNADDTQSEDVLIRFSTGNHKLIVANKGEAFSIAGIESLMMANLSPKTTRKYIGNKGLGFRSILNWANKIVIHTNGCQVEFSPQIAKEEWTELVRRKPEIRDLIGERGLADAAIPFPILSIPRIKMADDPDPYWTTMIEIDFKKEFEPKIKAQLLECREEILLFLNNIEKISIEQQDNEPIKYKRTKVTEGALTYMEIKDKVWRVESRESPLPPHLQDQNREEEELYKITVAFQDDLSDTYYKLFNFFPAKLSIHLPCIIHATFELNSSRDYLIESDKNKFILEQLVLLLKECALKMANESAGKANWKPFRMILPVKTETDSKLIGDFYTSLKALHNELQVFPCVDGSYAKLNQVKYYGKAFSEFILKKNLSGHLPFLLYPEEKKITDSFPLGSRPYAQTEFVPVIDQLSRAINNIEDRAELISLLLDEGFNPHRDEKYALLVNDEDEIIGSDNVAFTPIIEADGTFHKPAFINIGSINRTLYDTLVTRHSAKFDKSEPDSREFQRLLKPFVNVQPYDSNNVLRRIITGTREKIRGATHADAAAAIIQMVNALYKNYAALKYKEETFTETCPLISDTDEIRDSHALFLGSSFPSGKITGQLYEGILTAKDFVAGIDRYELNNEDGAQVEAFFIWLGVNRYVQFNKISINKEQWASDPYYSFVFKTVPRPDPVTRFYFSGTEIGLFKETVAKLSSEKFIFLILKEAKILNALELKNPDEFSYQYGNRYPEISEKPSYISFQLSALKRFTNYLIESNDIPFVNEHSINYDDPIFKQFGIKRSQVNDVLKKLGAQESFTDLETAKVYELIKKCGDLEAEPKHARKLYTLALEHFKTKNVNGLLKSAILPGTRLLATRNGEKSYISVDGEDDIYYSDNSTLPELITRNLWMFDFPKRSGEVQISNYYSVKTFKDLKVTIVDGTAVEHPEARIFDAWFSQIRPLILTHRLSQKIEDKKGAANVLKKCRIKLVSQITYSVNDGAPRQLGFDEFLVSGDEEFLVCAESKKSLTNFKNSSKFCGSFAEIMCILFKVNEAKNSYVSVFKDDFEFSKELIKADSLDEYMKEAYDLLGLSVFEAEFWKAVCKLKAVEWPDTISDTEQLSKFLKSKLQIELPKNYDKVDFEKFCSSESIILLGMLQEDLQITPTALSKHDQWFRGVKDWHISRMIDVSREIENQYANAVWQQLRYLTATEQKQYLSKRSMFRKWFCDIEWSDVDLPPMEIKLNYRAILLKMTSDFFGLELEKGIEPIEIHADYNQLARQYEDFEKSLNEEQKSLLYFGGHLDEIKEFIQRSAASEAAERKEDADDKTVLPIVEGKLGIKTPAGSSLKHGKKQVGSVIDPGNDRAKKKAGKNAEQKVRDTLIDTYGRENVQWVSGNSNEAGADDTLGYDFRYRISADDNWHYLEVKSVSGPSFIITNNEIVTAFSNKSKYHLALVKEGQIIIDKEFFANAELEQEYYRINSGFTIRPHDFEIYVDFSTVFLPVNSLEKLVET